MRHFYKYSLFILLITNSMVIFSQHTFSIVAIDPSTGEIGSAGATCISQEDGALAISDIVLGVGVIHTQAWWEPTNQSNARARMVAGDSPQEIINWLVANDVDSNPTIRQYGVVDLNNGSPRSAAHTGSNTDNIKLHVTGSNYSIQGNILISSDVIYDMESAFNSTTGTLADKLMAALQGAKRPGADSRCLQSNISSASAFLRVANPNDTDSSYGNLSLDLNVWITGEIFEPIDALQDAYNATLLSPDFYSNELTIYPNPTQESITIEVPDHQLINRFTIIDTNGRVVKENQAPMLNNIIKIDLSSLENGLYFIKLYDDSKQIGVKKIIKQ